MKSLLFSMDQNEHQQKLCSDYTTAKIMSSSILYEPRFLYLFLLLNFFTRAQFTPILHLNSQDLNNMLSRYSILLLILKARCFLLWWFRRSKKYTNQKQTYMRLRKNIYIYIYIYIGVERKGGRPRKMSGDSGGTFNMLWIWCLFQINSQSEQRR